MQQAREADWKGKIRSRGQHKLLEDGEQIERDVEQAIR